DGDPATAAMTALPCKARIPDGTACLAGEEPTAADAAPRDTSKEVASPSAVAVPDRAGGVAEDGAGTFLQVSVDQRLPPGYAVALAADPVRHQCAAERLGIPGLAGRSRDATVGEVPD